MSVLKKFAAAVLAAGAAVAMTPAKAVVVGGIDFGAVGLFSHIETATIAASYSIETSWCGSAQATSVSALTAA